MTRFVMRRIGAVKISRGREGMGHDRHEGHENRGAPLGEASEVAARSQSVRKLTSMT